MEQQITNPSETPITLEKLPYTPPAVKFVPLEVEERLREGCSASGGGASNNGTC